MFQLCALALSFVLSHLTCGGRSGGVARAWWEDGSLVLWDFFLLCGCSYPQPRDSQSVSLVVLFSCRLLRGALPVAGLWPSLVYPALLVFCSVVDLCSSSCFLLIVAIIGLYLPALCSC